MLPCRRRAHDAQNQSDNASHHGVPHRTVGSKSRRNVAANDCVKSPIGRRQQKELIGHALPQSGINLQRVQNRVRAESKE